MLTGRYIHLHEALGLGPMWLRSHARIITLPENTPAATPSKTAVSAPKHDPSQARLMVLQRMRHPHDNEPSAHANISKPPAAVTVQPSAADTPEISDNPIAAVQTAQAAQRTVKVLVLSVCPTPEDITAGHLFSGEDGILLDKMLQAVSLNRHDVHLDTWLQVPDFNPNPDAAAISSSGSHIAATIAACQPKALLLMGHFFQRSDVLAELDKIRNGLPLFHTPHPRRLAAQPKLKREAWVELQRMQHALTAA